MASASGMAGFRDGAMPFLLMTGFRDLESPLAIEEFIRRCTAGRRKSRRQARLRISDGGLLASHRNVLRARARFASSGICIGNHWAATLGLRGLILTDHLLGDYIFAQRLSGVIGAAPLARGDRISARRPGFAWLTQSL